MPGVGAICRYFFALRVLCKLLKKSSLQFSSLESRKFFTLFSQNWRTEIHTHPVTPRSNASNPQLRKDPARCPSRCHGRGSLMKCEGRGNPTKSANVPVAYLDLYVAAGRGELLGLQRRKG